MTWSHSRSRVVALVTFAKGVYKASVRSKRGIKPREKKMREVVCPCAECVRATK